MVWFTSWKRDFIVLGGIIGVFVLVWFATPYLWDIYNTSRELPKSVPTKLSLEEREKTKVAMKELQKKISENPREKKELSMKLASHYEQLGLPRKAAHLYRKIVRSQQYTSEGITALARLYEQAGRYEQAKIYYEQGYELQPSSREFYEQYAQFLITTDHDVEHARGVYLQGLLQTHNDKELLKQFITFLEKYGYGEEAQLYKEYLKIK